MLCVAQCIVTLWVEQMGIHGRFAGQIFRVLLRACDNFQVVLPLLGRHCRDMLSDQSNLKFSQKII